MAEQKQVLEQKTATDGKEHSHVHGQLNNTCVFPWLNQTWEVKRCHGLTKQKFTSAEWELCKDSRTILVVSVVSAKQMSHFEAYQSN